MEIYLVLASLLFSLASLLVSLRRPTDQQVQQQVRLEVQQALAQQGQQVRNYLVKHYATLQWVEQYFATRQWVKTQTPAVPPPPLPSTDDLTLECVRFSLQFSETAIAQLKVPLTRELTCIQRDMGKVSVNLQKEAQLRQAELIASLGRLRKVEKKGKGLNALLEQHTPLPPQTWRK